MHVAVCVGLHAFGPRMCVCVCDPVHYLVAVPRMSSALKLAGKREVNVQIGPIDAVIGPF